MKKRSRPNLDSYMLGLAMQAATRATCPRLHVGAIVARDGHAISQGYNGSLPGEVHCDEVGCLIHQGHCLRTTHAEGNAVAKALKAGGGDTLYCTHRPCLICLKQALAAGIWRIVYIVEYKAMPEVDLFIESLRQKPELVRIDPGPIILDPEELNIVKS